MTETQELLALAAALADDASVSSSTRGKAAALVVALGDTQVRDEQEAQAYIELATSGE